MPVWLTLVFLGSARLSFNGKYTQALLFLRLLSRLASVTQGDPTFCTAPDTVRLDRLTRHFEWWYRANAEGGLNALTCRALLCRLRR